VLFTEVNNTMTSYLLLSDLHFEHDRGRREYSGCFASKPADVVLLAGDIGVGTSALPFIRHLLHLDCEVVYIMGNHEFYRHDIDETLAQWYDIAKTQPKLHILSNESVVIGETEIFGSTLWTSLDTKHRNEQIEFFKAQMCRTFSDFTCIPKLSRGRWQAMHFDAVQWLQSAIKKSDAKYKIMMTHYLPTALSISDKYINNSHNFLFYTELGDWLVDTDLDIIAHGHTHDSVDKDFFGKRLLCNPRGYNDICMINPDFHWSKALFSLG
jgi:predicted phosphodiesterase